MFQKSRSSVILLLVALLFSMPAFYAFADSSKTVLDVQKQLKGLGYDPGPVDGVLGKQTEGAIKKFQSSNNLAVTGVVDSSTASILGVQIENTSDGSAWKNNCDLRYDYSNKLIFSVTESNGRTSWMADDRAQYVSIFKELQLDSAPALSARRGRILKLINSAPGWRRIVVSSKLSKEVDLLLNGIAKRAKKNGVECGE